MSDVRVIPADPAARAELLELAATKLEAHTWRALEDANALPLPKVAYDCVVDDPDAIARHEYRGVEAVSPRAAAVEAYRRAMRDEGFRCVANHPAGDEQTVAIAPELIQWVTVHLAGNHPGISG